MMHLDLIYEPLHEIMEHAGAILLKYFHTKLDRQEKPDGSFFTQADIATERFLIEQLSLLIPGSSIIAEERGRLETKSDYVWIIDPLDGTNNFSRELPYFCISVALSYKGRLMIGATYNPLQQEFFYAAYGKGTYLNGKLLHLSGQAAKPMIVIKFPSDAQAMQGVPIFNTLANFQASFRYLGASALDCAYLAAGRIDGLIFFDSQWWDVAAGIVLIEQAGGKVSDCKGAPFDNSSSGMMLAGNVQTHAELLAILEGTDLRTVNSD